MARRRKRDSLADAGEAAGEVGEAAGCLFDGLGGCSFHILLATALLGWLIVAMGPGGA